MTRLTVRAQRRMASNVAAGLVIVLVGCVHTPSVAGVAGTAPAPNAAWTPPREASTQVPPTTPPPALPPDIAQRIQSLTLADIVTLALQNNPTTRASWAAAVAAAAVYGSQKGAYYPSLNGAVDVTRQKSVGRFALQQTTYGPSLTLSYLLLDFGGRSGAVEQAKQALYAADWTHNATIQTVVLDVESAYFNYLATKALVTANETSVQEAQTNLQATQERHQVGLATVADVLQAQTALSQAQLNLETTEGTLQTTRGSLAVSMGLPANVPYDVAAPTTQTPAANVTDSVDTLIAEALRARPDLAAAQAEFQAARAHIGAVRAARLPSFTVNGSAGRTFFTGVPAGFNTTPGNTYTLSLGVSIPIFAGFSRAYNQMQAEAQAQAASAQFDALQQQVIFQVFSSYYTLQTATARVHTADDLLASAQQSEQVALGRYREGVGTIIDLLTAESALASARAQQVQARWVWETALSQLAHDVGVLDVHGGRPLRVAPDTTKSPPR